MGKAKRRREEAERRRQQRQTRLRRFALPGSLALIAGIAGIALAYPQLGGTPAHAAEDSAGQPPQVAKAKQTRTVAGPRPPAPSDLVRVYQGGREPWDAMPLREVARGKQFMFDGHLFRVNPQIGALELVHGITEQQLAEALKDYDRTTHRSPDADDVVELLAQDNRHVEFRRLRTVEPGSLLCFQKAVYEAVALDGYLQIKPTGNVFKRVTRTFKRPATTIVDLTIRGPDGEEQTLHGTPEHPFFVPSMGTFVPMGDLVEGTDLRTSSGETATVSSTTQRTGDFEVYNFEVEDTHTYYVAEREGAPAVWVHNTCAVDVTPGHTPDIGVVRLGGPRKPGVALGKRAEVPAPGHRGISERAFGDPRLKPAGEVRVGFAVDPATGKATNVYPASHAQSPSLGTVPKSYEVQVRQLLDDAGLLGPDTKFHFGP